MSIKYFNLEKFERARALGGSEETILANYVKMGGSYEGNLDVPVRPTPAPAKLNKGRSKKK